MKNLMEETKEEFRQTMAKFFYLIGDDEAFQNILTESDERLMLDAYNFAINHFKTCIKEFKGDQN